MGTSGAFGGSGGKDAKDLRDSIADWLIDASPATPATPATADAGGDEAAPGTPGQPQPSIAPKVDLRPAIRIISGGGRGGDGPGGGGGGARGGGSGSGGRSSGGATRSSSRTARAAGRASALARAYAVGDRATLARAGLNYGDLQALGSIVAIGTRIVEAAFDSRADSTIADEESRETIAKVVEWILESPADQTPTPDEIVRRSIELMITDVTLTEVGDTIRAEPSREKRAETEQEIRYAAQVYASQVTLDATGPSEQEIAAAIQGGIEQLGRIFGEAE